MSRHMLKEREIVYGLFSRPCVWHRMRCAVLAHHGIRSSWRKEEGEQGVISVEYKSAGCALWRGLKVHLMTSQLPA